MDCLPVVGRRTKRNDVPIMWKRYPIWCLVIGNWCLEVLYG
jgi:hypothetical protein